ncbi:MAG: DUF4392 domain-containing protein [Porticoccaceae bacterium]|nr:DUF4392 domain-containing protein [Pseudomonadales bacterium]MCP5171044.1 DUF4392 domain-containing protein [Pseudomonadales bacterium]MCP5301717.1 DUF4392 domain-containing protein [Pseudomonadales bacterium]
MPVNIAINEAETLSDQIERLLVSRNLRGMATVRPALRSGYCLRAAELLDNCCGTVMIGTGFPVKDTFETDGPVGAIALYRALAAIGKEPVLACATPLASVLENDFRVVPIAVGASTRDRQQEAGKLLERYCPAVVISIEQPGQAVDGGYYNMRGESIAHYSHCYDVLIGMARCPTIAIGDGGNEVGMGNIREALMQLDIIPAVSTCDELVVADVSNWGCHALVVLLGWLREIDLLADFDNRAELQYLSDRGSVDGISGQNTLTEDGLLAEDGADMIFQLRRLTGFAG